MAEKGKESPNSGKKNNQRMKPYLVLQYLLKYSDENHPVSAKQIAGYLQEAGIDAERRGIYKDIEEINKAMLMAERDMYLDEAEEELDEYGDESKYIVYDASKKGFYVRERRYEFDEIRLAAETIYASRYLTERESKTLVDVVCSFVSDYQAEQIKHDVFLTDRIKTDNKHTFSNIATINAAMSKELDGKKHTPEKITFKYLKYTISDLKQQVERRHGDRYSVSPYVLLLNNGNYYLYAFDDKYQDMRTYRVDRMRDVRLTGQPRDGAKVFAAVNMKDYTQRTFSMFGGKLERVKIRFPNNMLDSVIDRFGTSGAQYVRADEKHFTVSVQVEVSEQFFGWLCGYGKKAKLIGPEKVVESYKKHLESLRNSYSE